MAVEIHEFSGTIEDIDVWDNGIIKFALGYDSGQYHNQKKFQVWPTQYQKPEDQSEPTPNPDAAIITNNDGATATVKYYTKQVTNKAGQSYPQNTVTEVEIGGNGSPPQKATSAAVSDSKPSEANTRSVVPEGSIAAYLVATCDELVELTEAVKAAVQSMVGGGGGSTGAAPTNPNAAPFLAYMESEGLSEVAVNKRLTELGVGSDYTVAFDHHLTAVAESYGKEWKPE